jgi:plastocyanin
MKRIGALAFAALLLGGCSGATNPGTDPVQGSDQAVAGGAQKRPAKTRPAKQEASKPKASAPAARPKSVDPRDGGLELALGEWAVTPEVDTIRPGRVTFVIVNRGTMAHGFEIELEGESSGHGSGDLFKSESELLQPGESTRMTVTLAPAVYKIECLVDGHDDMGMEGFLAVEAGAPLVKEKPKPPPGSPSSDGSVSIANFAFDPSNLEVQAGTNVVWSNDDPAPHTVTALDDAFDSDIIDEGGSFSFTFDKPGKYEYRCNVHPDMKGTVNVK